MVTFFAEFLMCWERAVEDVVFCNVHRTSMLYKEEESKRFCLGPCVLRWKFDCNCSLDDGL